MSYLCSLAGGKDHALNIFPFAPKLKWIPKVKTTTIAPHVQSENRNNLIYTASSVTLFVLNISQICKKSMLRALGSSSAIPQNIRTTDAQ